MNNLFYYLNNAEPNANPANLDLLLPSAGAQKSACPTEADVTTGSGFHSNNKLLETKMRTCVHKSHNQ